MSFFLYKENRKTDRQNQTDKKPHSTRHINRATKKTIERITAFLIYLLWTIVSTTTHSAMHGKKVNYE